MSRDDRQNPADKLVKNTVKPEEDWNKSVPSCDSSRHPRRVEPGSVGTGALAVPPEASLRKDFMLIINSVVQASFWRSLWADSSGISGSCFSTPCTGICTSSSKYFWGLTIQRF